MKLKSTVLIAILGIIVTRRGSRRGPAGQSPGRGQSLIKTPAEEANYLAYSQNEAIAAFLSALAARTPELRVSTVGRSLRTPEYGARDIFLAVLAEKPAADAGGARPDETHGPLHGRPARQRAVGQGGGPLAPPGPGRGRPQAAP